MKRLLFYLALLIAVSPAMGDNLYVEDVVLPSGGSISVPVRYHFETEGLYGGYQFEVNLPDGVTAVLNSNGDPTFNAGDGLDNSFLPFSGLDPESGNGLYCGFSEGKFIQKNDGTLITLLLTANSTLEKGAKLIGKITKAALGNVDGETTVPLDDVEFNITIGEPEEIIPTDISQLDNVIYIEPTAGLTGTTIDLCVKLKNSLISVGCTFKLTLPEGLQLQNDEDGDVVYQLSSRAKKMSLTWQDWNNGTYDFALTPSTGTATISGSDDVVVTFKLPIPEDMVEGDYALKLTKCLIQSKVDGTTTDYPLSDLVTTLTVEDYVIGDVNGDRKVTPSDAIMILYHYFDVEQTGFNVKAADVNGYGGVTPADAIEALYIYFNDGSQSNARQMQKTLDPQ